MNACYVTSFRAMGCQVNAWLESETDASAVLQAVPGQVEAIEERLSRFRPESELTWMNAHVGEWVTVSETMLANLMAAKQGARLTNGLFNPLIHDALVAAGYDRSFERISDAEHSSLTGPTADWRDIAINVAQRRVRLPGKIDLGGVAKGWTAEKIADGLAAHGPCLVDMGGDLVARGTTEWDIAIAEPDGTANTIGSVHVRDMSVITSGVDFRRWQQDGQAQHHLIDPERGVPAETDVRSVTVIHPHAPRAEAYAKAVVMLGSKDGLAWIQRQWNSAALVIRQDGAALATDRFLAYFKEGAQA